MLFHSVTRTDVTVEQRRCFSSPLKKRAVLQQTPLVDKMAVANVLLTYWNLYDDIVDGGSVKKKVAFRALRRAYLKAQELMPDLDGMLALRYAELRKQEEQNVNSIDAVSHSFALLSEDFALHILGEQAGDDVLTLCYNLGKWIYLIDALDDVDKDIRKGNYNPFVTCYGVGSAEELCSVYDELQFIMYAVLNRVAMSYNDLNLDMYTCILQNVFFDSIRDKTKEILARYRKTSEKAA